MSSINVVQVREAVEVVDKYLPFAPSLLRPPQRCRNGAGAYAAVKSGRSYLGFNYVDQLIILEE